MRDLMQHWEMRVSHIIDHAAKYHPNRPIISRSVEGPIETTNWAGIHEGARKTAQALTASGLKPGEAVGVMAWNTARHLKVWYGVSGAGCVLHTLNPRLSADQLVYIINHAEDRMLMVDPDLAPVIAAIADRLETVKQYVILTDRAHMPDHLPGALCYEEWIGAEDGDFAWVEGDEREACGICYTSGTTGNPKGVVYTHRSNMLHALAASAPDCVNLSSRDVLMPVVPLFHANGWSLAYTAPMNGAAMVMPGRDMTPAALYEMLEHGVTLTAAVPTIWLGMLRYLKEGGKSFSTLKRVVIGGSSCPRAVIEAFQNDYGVQVLHAWGMTETSPLGSTGSLKPEVASLDDEAKLDIQCTVGHPPFTVDLKITDDSGEELPWDGAGQGKLWVRGPGVVRRYLKAEKDAAEPDGWFDTGDVATMDANAYVRITDRSKDVIKSGGEWISSIDMENAAVGHPGVAEAAAVGVPHPKWDERPILVCVKAPGENPDPEDIIELASKGLAKWQRPDDVLFVDELPHTATGKISKLHLRQRLKEMDYKLPEFR
ncbi:long-chain-fatty-acid--CoA ligase [Pikeienuella piscinae]|uniref:3-methylmercaptopropionyl-CoA ligase n=1 Tax=Pikeienuella piscinae TaxID=2748098 RepID=A0A7L5BXI9_9RHOB|nr:long-chain-fatty-acid--CoA ligase [Pikeienuella piscinae]QIE56442.1 long-chain-fatty-acid--CoA ligase [Pikeienuella piscinae]